MKSFFMERVLPFLLIITMCFAFLSCSDTEVEPDPTAGLIKIKEGYAAGAAVKVELWAREQLFAGYNPVFFALYDSTSGKPINDSHIHIHPVMDMRTMTHSCPVEEPESNAVDGLFPAAIMFTMPSGDMGSWTLLLNIHNHQNGQSGTALFDIVVHKAFPEKIVSFVADDGNRYYLSHYFPEKLAVGVNKIEVVAFTTEAGEFIPAERMNIKLTPEMPSMEHGSPNNVDPVHILSGHYLGKANFTMTGEWRLHLDLMNGDTPIGSRYFDVVVK